MIKVYHNRLFTQYAYAQPDRIPRIILELVATIPDLDEKGLEKAFELTNHIESDWTENEGVTPVKMRPRSTSVGDVLEIDGKFYMVAGCGYKEVTLIERNEMDKTEKKIVIQSGMCPPTQIKELNQIFKDKFDKYFTIK